MHTRYKYLNDLLLFSFLYRERKTILSLLHTHNPWVSLVSYPLTELERHLRLIGFNVTHKKNIRKHEKGSNICCMFGTDRCLLEKNVATLNNKATKQNSVFFLYDGSISEIMVKYVPTHNLFIYKSKEKKKGRWEKLE